VTPAEVLTKAADLIEQGGHCKGTPRWGTAYCASEAIYAACPELVTKPTGRTCRAARRAFYDAIHSPGITSWNDAPERTADEVVAKLREAAQAVTS
jgi:hypothetical protein